MSAKDKLRVDQLAVERGLFPSRAQAHAAVLAGEVFSGDRLLTKPGHLVKRDLPLSIRSRRPRYVGRGGYKLEGALREFHIDVNGLLCLDIGSSTGGFTDCLLQHGARHVWCIDVGKGQLDMHLRQDGRVTVQEGVNARYLKPENFPEPFNLAVIDVSFISLNKILPAVSLLLQARTGFALALIKPQFEVGPAAIGKGGVVRDKQAREDAIQHVLGCLPGCGLKKAGVKPSCLKGTDGNQEYFLWAEKTK
ncbi:TlyA family RNA methyltransferase [candidate division FCPU426 bacterium]|nr:TlyA family RNA methyltransferase [candidate division FCPU426 bacterium]